MKIIKVKKEDRIKRNIADSYQVMNYITVRDSVNVSLAVSEAKNHHETTRTSSDRIYYVLEGKIVVNDECIASVGDAIFISANTEYTFKGSFKSILVNSPAFKGGDKPIIHK